MNTRTLAALAITVMLLALLGMYMSQRPKIEPNISLSQLQPASFAAQSDQLSRAKRC